MECSNESTIDSKLQQVYGARNSKKYSEDGTRVGDVKQNLSIIRQKLNKNGKRLAKQNLDSWKIMLSG